MTDQSQVLGTVGDLLAAGATAGAARVLFNASLIAQREAAKGLDLKQWTPAGPIPLGRKAEKHPHAANDHSPPSSAQPGGTVA